MSATADPVRLRSSSSRVSTPGFTRVAERIARDPAAASRAADGPAVHRVAPHGAKAVAEAAAAPGGTTP